MQSIIVTAPKSTGIALVPAPPTGPPPRTRCAYALEVVDAPETLERVLGQLRRRQCRITAVDFVGAEGRHAEAWMVVGIEAPEARVHLVESWLAGISAVLSVEPIDVPDAPRAAEPPRPPARIPAGALRNMTWPELWTCEDEAQATGDEPAQRAVAAEMERRRAPVMSRAASA